MAAELCGASVGGVGLQTFNHSYTTEDSKK